MVRQRSTQRLVWQRLLATLAGAAVITAAVTAALAAVAAVVVAWLRSAAAVVPVAVFVAASHLLVYLVPLFAWPDWVDRTTVFGAYGNPYLELPAASGLILLAGLAAGGGLLAATLAQRSPKAAT